MIIDLQVNKDMTIYSSKSKLWIRRFKKVKSRPNRKKRTRMRSMRAKIQSE